MANAGAHCHHPASDNYVPPVLTEALEDEIARNAAKLLRDANWLDGCFRHAGFAKVQQIAEAVQSRDLCELGRLMLAEFESAATEEAAGRFGM